MPRAGDEIALKVGELYRDGNLGTAFRYAGMIMNHAFSMVIIEDAATSNKNANTYFALLGKEFQLDRSVYKVVEASPRHIKLRYKGHRK